MYFIHVQVNVKYVDHTVISHFDIIAKNVNQHTVLKRIHGKNTTIGDRNVLATTYRYS
jgi:hypothetical protein